MQNKAKLKISPPNKAPQTRQGIGPACDRHCLLAVHLQNIHLLSLFLHFRCGFFFVFIFYFYFFRNKALSPWLRAKCRGKCRNIPKFRSLTLSVLQPVIQPIWAGSKQCKMIRKCALAEVVSEHPCIQRAAGPGNDKLA